MAVAIAMDSQTVTAWMNEIAASVRAERDYLVQLDAAIGDGDHGINLNRGFDAVTRRCRCRSAELGRCAAPSLPRSPSPRHR